MVPPTSRALRQLLHDAWRNLGVGLLDIILPPACVYCQRDPVAEAAEVLLCTPCLDLLTSDKVRRCPGCGLAGRAGTKCPHCRRAKYYFHSVTSLGAYRDDLREAVIRSKQLRNAPLAFALGKTLAGQLHARSETLSVDGIVPIPKFWLKRLRRGYNAAETLADGLADVLGQNVYRVLRCHRTTSKQSLLNRQKRQQNLRGAFSVRSRCDIRQKRLLIVDDIMTTGATASEAARVLQRAGAAWIEVAVVARAD